MTFKSLCQMIYEICQKSAAMTITTYVGFRDNERYPRLIKSFFTLPDLWDLDFLEEIFAFLDNGGLTMIFSDDCYSSSKLRFRFIISSHASRRVKHTLKEPCPESTPIFIVQFSSSRSVITWAINFDKFLHRNTGFLELTRIQIMYRFREQMCVHRLI